VIYKLQFVFIVIALFVLSLMFSSIYVTEDVLSSSSSSSFTFVKKIPQEGTSEIQIFEPEGIDVDSEGNVYVNDIGPNRILKFSKNGTYVLSWGSTGSGNGKFNHPHGNEVDSQGNVYITDQDNQRVQKFTSNGTFITKWGAPGT
jgi:DNA-binding beta-propeller fold protein YncE